MTRKVSTYKQRAKRNYKDDKLPSVKQRKSILALPKRKQRRQFSQLPISPEKKREAIRRSVKKGAYYCSALNCEVEITSPTIRHFNKDSGGSRSALAAQLNYKDILQKAKLIYADLPKDNKSQKGFEIMYFLYYKMAGIGTVKLVIGRQRNNRRIVYTIDAVEIWP